MVIPLIDKTIIISDIMAVFATIYFILIAIFTKDPCFSLIQSYSVVTPVFTSYFGRAYKRIFFRKKQMH